MDISKMSDKAILKELGLRISRYRLNKNMTQKILAVEAGVSKSTIQRAERGDSVQVVKMIRILRVLDLIENMESLIPKTPFSPIQKLKMMGKVRQRAFPYHKSHKKSEKWSWEEKE